MSTSVAFDNTHAASSIDTVISRDGTHIAYERQGRGTPVILVDGAMCRRGLGPSSDLAKLLAPHFTVITYDRRGRGASGDTPPYTVEREVEDIEALVAKVGGSAYLWGASSGGVLALDAAQRIPGVRKVALYEPPIIADSTRESTRASWTRIDAAIAANDRGVAVKEFLRMVGVPAFFVGLMRLSPMWKKLVALAPTLPYDGAIIGELQKGRAVPTTRWSAATVPTLVMTGGGSPEWMRQGNRALSRVLPNASERLLEGQAHNVKPEAHAPALIEFFGRSTP